MKITLLFLCLVGTLNAQVLFDEGSSGFDIGAQFTSTKISTLIGFSTSYTLNGKLSFGVGIASESLKDFDLTSTAVRPFFSYLAVRQSEDLPINVAHLRSS